MASIASADGATGASLNAGDLILTEEGVRTSTAQGLRKFSETGQGVAVLLALDASGSMRGRPLDAVRKGLGQFVANNFHHLLVGRKLEHHFAAERLAADVGEQLVGHAEGHVAFEQRLADLRQRGVEMLLGQLSLPAKVLERALQLLGEVLKHASILGDGNGAVNARRTGVAPLELRQLQTN